MSTESPIQHADTTPRAPAGREGKEVAEEKLEAAAFSITLGGDLSQISDKQKFKNQVIHDVARLG